MSFNFALIGAGGFVAPRHLKAIQDTGNRLLAATDPHDAVGILDKFSFDVRFFPEIERFDRQLEKLRRGPEENRVHFVSICSRTTCTTPTCAWRFAWVRTPSAKSPW